MPETQVHMDIARSAGVTMVGNPNWPGTLAVGEPPDASFIVLKAPDERYYELYNSAGAMAVRVITSPYGTHGRDPTIGSFGKSASSCMWVRGLGSTTLYFVDAGVYKFFGVTAGGALTAPTAAPVNPQMVGTSRMGGTFEATTGRLVIEAAAGTASGLVLQNPSEVPWVIWVDAAGTLKITDWPTFVQVGLTITTASLAGGTVGVAYSATLVASGGVTPYTWSLASGTLPVPLTLSTAGVIAGTPTATGTSNFTVKVVAAGATTTKALSIVVA